MAIPKMPAGSARYDIPLRAVRGRRRWIEQRNVPTPQPVDLEREWTCDPAKGPRGLVLAIPVCALLWGAIYSLWMI